jgi:hypothetical protein
MTIKAGGRMALIAATGLLVCVASVSWTTAASSAPEQKSEYVSTSKKVKQVRYYKRYAHRKYARTAQISSEEKKPVEVAEAGLPSELPASVANANARMGEITDTTRAMTARANALLTSDQPTEGQGAVTMQMAEADQLNDADKALQESAQPSQTTVAVAPTKAVATAKPAPSETSTWDQTSLIGKIFIAFGALLTVASAARMFMA